MLSTGATIAMKVLTIRIQSSRADVRLDTVFIFTIFSLLTWIIAEDNSTFDGGYR
jgi:hypothetical protein